MDVRMTTTAMAGHTAVAMATIISIATIATIATLPGVPAVSTVIVSVTTRTSTAISSVFRGVYRLPQLIHHC